MKTKIFLLAVVSIIFSACKKADTDAHKESEPTPYYVRMTDAPGPYTAVNIDIQKVEITGPGGAVTLNTQTGIYDLLKLSNGTDTLIATGSLNMARVSQIRFILGSNNSVAVGGSVFPLTIPSGGESGLKLNVHHVLQPGVAYYVLLDFDANQSVVRSGNGMYHLKPVIRTTEAALSGAIRGNVNPGGVAATVTAFDGNASFSSVVDAQGNFIIQGVPAGVYSLTVLPASPYQAVTVSNVTVITGSVSSTGTLNI